MGKFQKIRLCGLRIMTTYIFEFLVFYQEFFKIVVPPPHFKLLYHCKFYSGSPKIYQKYSLKYEKFNRPNKISIWVHFIAQNLNLNLN